MDRMDKHLDEMIDIVTHWVAYNSYRYIQITNETNTTVLSVFSFNIQHLFNVFSWGTHF